MRMRLLIIGAGPTSALLSFNLRKHFLREQLDIHIWEKSAEIGGRFYTLRSPTGANNYVDLGAQYLTWNHRCSWLKPHFDELIECGLLQHLETSCLPGFQHDDTKTNFVCTKGTSSIVEYYFDQAKVLEKVKTQQKVTKVECSSSILADPQVFVTTEDGFTEQFDAIVSTIPVPELLELNIMGELLQRENELLQVSYSKRFALGIFFNEKLSLSAFCHPLNFVRKAESPIRYWSIENLKRSAGNIEEAALELPSVVAHTSIDYGTENIELEPEIVKDYLIDQLSQETDLVKQKSILTAICHKWKYSQVVKPYPDSPGFIVVSKSPLIICAGDSFTYSGFEGCILSAAQTGEYFRKNFEQ